MTPRRLIYMHGEGYSANANNFANGINYSPDLDCFLLPRGRYESDARPSQTFQDSKSWLARVPKWTSKFPAPGGQS